MAVGVAFSFEKIIDETSKAQSALAQLNVAFGNAAESSNRSKKEIVDFAEQTAAATTFSHVAILEAQTSLLRFGRISGDTFERARNDILDVASALGTDLQTAAFAVGRALESPSQGLRQLRSMGVIFTETQRKVIQNLEETGQVAKAQEIILSALEDRFSGAASAARNTLGGALEALKHSLSDLFESTDSGANDATKGVNELAAVISDPKFKESIQTLTGLLLSFVGAFVNVTATAVSGLKTLAQYLAGFKGIAAPKTGIDALFDKQSNLGASLQSALSQQAGAGSGTLERRQADELVEKIRGMIKDVENDLNSKRQGQGGPQGIGSRQATKPGGVDFVSDAQAQQERDDALAASRAKIDEVSITARKKNIEGITKLLQDFDEQTQGSLEKINQDYEETFLKLKELLDAGTISATRFAERLRAAKDKYEEAATIDPVKITAQRVQEHFSSQEIAIHEFVATAQEGLQNLAQSGDITAKSIVRYLLAAFESKILYNAINELGAHLSQTLIKATAGSASGSLGSLLGSLLGSFGGTKLGGTSGVGNLTGSTAGFAAGGGNESGPRVVGEDGPELLFNSGQVMNRRQLAFAMGGAGGGVTLTTNNEWHIDGTASPQAVAQYVETRMQSNNRKQLEQIQRLMRNNGFGSLR